MVADSQSDSVAAATNGKENVSAKANPSVRSGIRLIFRSVSLNASYSRFQMPKPKFLAWYNSRKAELQSEKPDLLPPELTKYAMGKYKEIFSDTSNGDDPPKNEGVTAKRKNDSENDTRPLAGVAKLAKFNFSK